MIVETESGSCYEIDEAGGRARKLAGTHTEMTAGGWRQYLYLFGPVVGARMLFAWDAPGRVMGARATQTTPVVRVTE